VRENRPSEFATADRLVPETLTVIPAVGATVRIGADDREAGTDAVELVIVPLIVADDVTATLVGPAGNPAEGPSSLSQALSAKIASKPTIHTGNFLICCMGTLPVYVSFATTVPITSRHPPG
jgi:hypothetical protein